MLQFKDKEVESPEERAQRQRWKDSIGGLADEHPVLKSIVEILREAQEVGAENVCHEKGEARDFWAGYMAAARDLEAGLRDLREKEQRDNNA